MSTEPQFDAFDVPWRSVHTYRLLRQILHDIFQPATAFCPPGEIDFSLNRMEGAEITEVLSEVREKVVAHSIHSRHTWSLAHMVPPPATVSVLADLLIGAMNQCAFIWEEAPVAAPLEAEVLRWVADRIGFGPRASGLVTSGGTMSNCLATYLAIQRAKTRLGQDTHPYCIIASDQAHFSVEKAACITGLGANAVVRVPTDSEGRLRPGKTLEFAIRTSNTGKIPVLFVCTSGTTNTGVLEPAEEILTVAQRFQAWCHIDAAHGGLMCLSTNAGPLVKAWQLADSISWDPHKTLYVSYSIGTLLVQDEEMLVPLEFHGDYALKDDGRLDAGARHLEGSRRLEALKLWMTIKHFGTAGFSNLVDHTLFLAKALSERIRSLDDFVLVTEPDTNIVCFQCVPPNLTPAATDQLNAAIQRALFRSGGPLISSTRVAGRLVLRMVLLNPRLKPQDLDDVLHRIRCEARRQISCLGRSESALEIGDENPACYQSSF